MGRASLVLANHFDIRDFLVSAARQGHIRFTLTHELHALRVFFDFLNMGGMVPWVAARFVKIRTPLQGSLGTCPSNRFGESLMRLEILGSGRRSSCFMVRVSVQASWFQFAFRTSISLPGGFLSRVSVGRGMCCLAGARRGRCASILPAARAGLRSRMGG